MQMNDKYRELFVRESRKNIRNLDRILTKISNTTYDREDIKEFLRVIHTIKGSAGMIGCDDICELAHTMEGVMEYIHTFGSGNSDVFDTLFDSLDVIDVLLDDIALNKKQNRDLFPIMVRLQKTIGKPKSVDAYKDKIKEYLAHLNIHLSKLKSEHYEQTDLSDLLDVIVGLKKISTYIVHENLHKLCVFTEDAIIRVKTHGELTPLITTILSECVIRFNEMCIDIIAGRSVDIDLFPLMLKLRTIPEEIKKIKTKKTEHIEITPDDEMWFKKMKELGFRCIKVSIHLNENTKIKNVNSAIDTLMEYGRITKKCSSEGKCKWIEFIFIGVKSIDDIREYLKKKLPQCTVTVQSIVVNESIKYCEKMIRRMSIEQDKKIRFLVEEDNVNIDRMDFSVIHDAIIHILRNAISHGIRKNGTVSMYVSRECNDGKDMCVIRIQDDGVGIDIKKIRKKLTDKNLISIPKLNNMSDKEIIETLYTPGFSAADNIDKVSGRGYGLCIVMQNVKGLNGDIDIETAVGKGTSITFRIPYKCLIKMKE